jgi:hypothetical protein
MIVRDIPLERDMLERAERVASVRGFADLVITRMNAVDATGGPDVPARTALEAAQGGHEELVDAPAWFLVALSLLADEVDAGTRDIETATEFRYLLEEAMAGVARVEHLARGAIALLGG